MPRQRGMPTREQILERRDFSSLHFHDWRCPQRWQAAKDRPPRKIRIRMVAAEAGSCRCRIITAAGRRYRAAAWGELRQVRESQHQSG